MDITEFLRLVHNLSDLYPRGITLLEIEISGRKDRLVYNPSWQCAGDPHGWSYLYFQDILVRPYDDRECWESLDPEDIEAMFDLYELRRNLLAFIAEERKKLARREENLKQNLLAIQEMQLGWEYYKKVFEEGEVWIPKKGGRRLITYEGEIFQYAKVLWNITFPDDMAGPGDSIHHKDFDRAHDEVSNYEKLTKSEHKHLHKMAERD